MSEAEWLSPHNEEAERELLGSLIAYFTPEIFEQVVAEIPNDRDFYIERHRIIWRGICAVGGQGGHVDHTTLAYFLAGRSNAAKESYLDLCGGSSTLAILVSYAVPHGIVDRARIVAKDGEWRRRLVKAREQVEACLSRDEVAWAALEGEAPRLRVIEGGEAVAS